MIASALRKLHQLADDSVLRRWLIGRAFGRWAGTPSFTPHQPPYLSNLLPLELESPTKVFTNSATGEIVDGLDIQLAGQTLSLNPTNYRTVFNRTFDDVEILLALHRFAWLPLLGPDVDPRWINVMWKTWRDGYGVPSDHWAWHPYTAAERAVNILSFARRHGMPGSSQETLDVLAAHGPVIADRLEYFGEHHTSNHLSNNGRGLYLLGLELGLDKATDIGLTILKNEFARIFNDGGVLREGSNHYQLLVTRNYADAWLAAKRHNRQEASTLETLTHKALSATAAMSSTAAMPRIGDLSPDCPPAWLAGLLPGGEGGWLDGLSDEDARNFLDLRQRVVPAPASTLKQTGWHRLNGRRFSVIAHAAPQGWSAMPGHGHQDVSGFELYDGNQPIIIDPGRGAYGESGDAAYYRSGRAHSGLMVDGADPYPPNRPYYDEVFRRLISGPVPQVRYTEKTMTLRHHGFSRLSGVDAHQRCWRISDEKLSIDDHLDGDGQHALVRSIITPLRTQHENGAIVLQGDQALYRLTWDDSATETVIEPITLWQAYGVGRPGHVVRLTTRAHLPWRGTLTLEAIPNVPR